ncbi:MULTISPECIES: cytochrome c-type biogenesis protein [Nitrincola]|uniref:Cytochrome c-type biogenesis protein n=1 Tax=Nitrincola nitratireducens TaxID=1229521 RepID=W9UYL8_9GAMM|nr:MULTISPECIES: cytochrome c-type biogenesis protein [Nitrincola]EXJ12194.1 Cytochrome c-type biogenesis protein CcmH precursor [Nitrincola nitratireducens]
MIRAILMLCMLSVVALKSHAGFETYEFSSVEGERRYAQLARELRCPTCQNQNISDSDAPLAADLRRELHRMIESQQTDDQILDFMITRYGDFVHYRPRIAPETYLLWYGPIVLMLIGLGVVLVVAKKRKPRQPAQSASSSTKATPSLSEGLTDDERKRLQSLLQQDDQK